MKAFQFFTFTVMALGSMALLIIGLSTLHWVTTNNTISSVVPGFQGEQTHSGVRRWYTEVNGESLPSNSWNNNCDTNYAQCRFYSAGSWAMGWGIAALALIAIAILVVALISVVTWFHGTRGKFTAATLMFLAFGCVLVGALTYWSHLPDLSGTDSNLSWSYVLYCIGGGLALVTSIVLCLLPNKHYYSSTTVVTQPATSTVSTHTTTAQQPVQLAPMQQQQHASNPYSPHTSSQPAYPANHFHTAPAQAPQQIVVQ